MINKALFKYEWKKNYKILLGFLAILTFYFFFIVYMFDPSIGAVLESLTKLMPDIMSMVSMNGITDTLIKHMANFLYGFLMIAVPLIFISIIGLNLVGKKIDNNSMSYLLSTGVSRKTVWFNQFIFLICNIIIMDVYVTVIGIVAGSIFFPGDLDIMAFIQLNIGVFCLHLLFSAIIYNATCIFEYSKAIILGVGFIVVSLLIQMLSNMQGSLEFLKYLSFINLYIPSDIIVSKNFIYLLILVVASIVLYVIGYYSFKNKDLSI